MTGFSTRTEAKTERTRFMEELRNGTAPNDMSKWTVETAVKRWLEYRKAISRSPRTYKKDCYVMAQLTKHLGGKRLEDMTAWAIEAHQAKRSKDMGSAQVNREVRYLAILLKKAHLWNRLRDDYKPLRVQKEVKARALTAEQARFLVELAEKHPRWNIVGWCAVLALNTGLRGGEIKQLTLGSIVNDPQPALWVGRATTKTDAGARRVPLNAMAQWAVSKLRERAEAMGSRKPTHYLLPENMGRHTKKNDPLHGKTGYDPTRPQISLRSAWESLCEEAGKRWKKTHKDESDPFADFGFHGLRHTFITHCGQAGVQIERVMAMVGHMSGEMTRYYMHLNDAATRSVVDKVENAMGFVAPELQTMKTASTYKN